ncbi:lytic transglycosylase domain-containing protein [Streptomyces iconiensis]|uniref:Lytic transglycosylase domain-containing protein n=1 Tax=Streptomyces iconiensis TaxID=1384038 RepID=A0ABT6ZZ39_9ACTN|nr:lytic transglycosylase domain-containing protein [Streptomyces iconiensis]MDJ1134329.1 lytic transglycosylase domain-containing protein [Streptomyces iconiensis]
MAEARKPWAWWVIPVLVLVVWGMARGGKDPDGGQASPPERPSGSPSASGTHSPSPDEPPAGGSSATPRKDRNYDPARYADPVRRHARSAGVSPRLVMAILYNEAYKPHDPELERSWQRFKPDAAFGIANMHRAAYEETRRNRDFASRSWDELPDDRDLAIKAAAWHLHDLAAQLDAAGQDGPYTKDQLLALGYNAGSGNMLAFARGAKPGRQAQSYLDRLRDNWNKAGKAVSP